MKSVLSSRLSVEKTQQFKEAYKFFSGWEKGTGNYAIKYTIADSESDSGQDVYQEQDFIN